MSVSNTKTKRKMKNEEFFLNEVSPSIRNKSLLSDKFQDPVPVYKDSEGKDTTDISKAQLDIYGKPVFVGYSQTEFTPHECYSDPNPNSFNPSDPTAVLRAIQARENLNKYSPEPEPLEMDKFEVL